MDEQELQEMMDQFVNNSLDQHVDNVGIGLEALASIHGYTNNMARHEGQPLNATLESRDALRTYVLAMFVELGEFVQELDWKPWRSLGHEIDVDRVADEFADILAFLGVIITILDRRGITPADLAAAYGRKERENMRRFVVEKNR